MYHFLTLLESQPTSFCFTIISNVNSDREVCIDMESKRVFLNDRGTCSDLFEYKL